MNESQRIQISYDEMVAWLERAKVHLTNFRWSNTYESRVESLKAAQTEIERTLELILIETEFPW